MAFNMLLLSLCGLIAAASCSLEDRMEDYYFNGDLQQGEFSYGFRIMRPDCGDAQGKRTQRQAASGPAMLFGSHNRRGAGGDQQWGYFIAHDESPHGMQSHSFAQRTHGRGFPGRQARLDDGGVRTEINYAAGKQPIVVKVRPRPHRPFPEVVRPLGGGRPAGHPFDQGVAAHAQALPGAFGQGVAAHVQTPPGAFGQAAPRPPSRRPAVISISPPRGPALPVVAGPGLSRPAGGPAGRPGAPHQALVVRDEPTHSPPFPQTVTSRPFRRPASGGLHQVYRPRPQGVFFVQGRDNPDRRGLVVDAPPRDVVVRGDVEVPLFGGQTTLTRLGQDTRLRFTNAHTVSRLRRPDPRVGADRGGRRSRLLGGWQSALLGVPPSHSSLIAAPQLQRRVTSRPVVTLRRPAVARGGARFTDTARFGITPRGPHRLAPVTQTALLPGRRRTGQPLLGAGVSALDPRFGGPPRRPLVTATPFGRATTLNDRRGAFFGAVGPTTPAFAVGRLSTARQPLDFTSLSSTPFGADPFRSTSTPRGPNEPPVSFRLPGGVVSFPALTRRGGTFSATAASPTGFPPTATSSLPGPTSFSLPVGEVVFPGLSTSSRPFVTAGPRLWPTGRPSSRPSSRPSATPRRSRRPPSVGRSFGRQRSFGTTPFPEVTARRPLSGLQLDRRRGDLSPGRPTQRALFLQSRGSTGFSSPRSTTTTAAFFASDDLPVSTSSPRPNRRRQDGRRHPGPTSARPRGRISSTALPGGFRSTSAPPPFSPALADIPTTPPTPERASGPSTAGTGRGRGATAGPPLPGPVLLPDQLDEVRYYEGPALRSREEARHDKRMLAMLTMAGVPAARRQPHEPPAAVISAAAGRAAPLALLVAVVWMRWFAV